MTFPNHPEKVACLVQPILLQVLPKNQLWYLAYFEEFVKLESLAYSFTWAKNPC
jgi:hypothetical protein